MMKPELQDKLVEVIGAIQTGVAKTTDFAVSQLPDVAQQFIGYGRVIETSAVVVFVVATVCGLVMVHNGMKKESEPMVGIGALTALLSATFAIMNFSSFVMVWMAPKIYIIKELARLLK